MNKSHFPGLSTAESFSMPDVQQLEDIPAAKLRLGPTAQNSLLFSLKMD